MYGSAPVCASKLAANINILQAMEAKLWHVEELVKWGVATVQNKISGPKTLSAEVGVFENTVNTHKC